MRIVLTTGCFDIIHRGHISLFEKAATFGDLLFVGINSDESIRELKGSTRPINKLEDRMEVVAAIESVSLVFPIYNKRVTDTIMFVSPYVWAKGGDYTINTLDKDEVKAAVDVGARIEIIPSVPGHSTTSILSRI